MADALFDPLAARQVADAAEADEAAVFNDTLLQVAVSYLQLVRAASRAAILEAAVQHSKRLAEITADFSRVGEGSRVPTMIGDCELFATRGSTPPR